MRVLIALVAVIAAIAAMFFVTGSPPASPDFTAAESAQYEAQVLQAVTDRLDAYEGVVTRGDLEGWWSYWAADARAMEPGMDLSGGDLREMARDFWESGGRVFSAEWEIQELFVHGEFAYLIGDIHESFQYPGQEPAEAHNHVFVRWERQAAGEWRMDRFLAAPMNAPEEG